MANGIIPVSWGKELRPSAVNSLDKINEVIHFINQSDIHELTLSDSGSGESVQTANSTQLLDLTVYGKSVQDGTPTPENPVPIQVVGSRNISQYSTLDRNTYTSNGITWEMLADGRIKVTGTATAQSNCTLTNNWVTLAFANVTSGARYTVSAQTDYMANTDIKIRIGQGASATWLNSFNGQGSFTPTQTIVYIGLSVDSGVTIDTVIGIQLEAGTQATPYGCIGLQIGETVTPIDMQGHTLAGLPDGTRDELAINAAGVNSIMQNVGYIASYNDESVGDTYISTTGQLTTGASVYYKLDTPQTIELGAIEPPAIPDGSIIKINASLTPVIDVEWFTETTLPKMMNSILDLVKSLHPNDFTVSAANANTLHSANQLTEVSEIQPFNNMDMGTIDKIRENEIEDENKDESEVN